MAAPAVAMAAATALLLSAALLPPRVLAEIKPVGFQNPYYQAPGYFGSRVLEHNQTDRFERYVEVTWSQHSVVDSTGRLWMVDRAYHQVLMILPETRYVKWHSYYMGYAGSHGVTGHFDGSRTQARFNSPMGIALCEPDGQSLVLYVSDTNNHAIRRLTYNTGRVVTIAGLTRQPGLRDGPTKYALLKHPMSLGVDAEGLNLFVLDNGRRIRHVTLTENAMFVTTLVDGACRSVARWTAPGSVVLRRVGCHPDWRAKDAGDEDVEEYIYQPICIGHQATCGPRNHPALSDAQSAFLQEAPNASAAETTVPATSAVRRLFAASRGAA